MTLYIDTGKHLITAFSSCLSAASGRLSKNPIDKNCQFLPLSHSMWNTTPQLRLFNHHFKVRLKHTDRPTLFENGQTIVRDLAFEIFEFSIFPIFHFSDFRFFSQVTPAFDISRRDYVGSLSHATCLNATATPVARSCGDTSRCNCSIIYDCIST